MSARSRTLAISRAQRVATAGAVVAALLAAAGTLVVLPVWQPYAWTWAALGLVFLSFKSVVVADSDPRRLPRLGWYLPVFVFLWPGMDLEPFLRRAERGTRWRPVQPDPLVRRYALTGLANLAAALGLLIVLRCGWLRPWPYFAALVGLSSLALGILFGLFDLLAAMWRARGVAVHKQWQFLPASRSLSDYWGRRWNRAFHDFARVKVYLPLKRRWGRTPALLGSFSFSGVIHDFILSVPAQDGYGLPTLYFLLQGLGLWVERHWLPAGPARRLWAWLVVLLPVPLLIHRPFVERVALAQLAALGLW